MALTEAIAAMPEMAHAMFVMACLEIGNDPYGQGGDVAERTAGGVTKRAWAVSSLGLIEYEVDEEASVITLISVISLI
ncbi:hypothetical protein [Catenulispora sp. GP43]|uniref:hypothetical protein n=1 Tax=Catenulispora sp. GP43 TaxID=3156263 RepID=UPI0035140C66